MKKKSGSLLVFAIFSAIFIHAQELATSGQTAAPDSIIQLTADAQGLPLMAPGTLPRNGTFWLAMPGGAKGGIFAPLPFPPQDPNLPVYAIAPGQFLVDGMGGQVTLNNRLAANATVYSVLEAQASSTMNLINTIQAADSGLLPPGAGYVAQPDFLTPPVYGTNDLWLQLNEATNTLTGLAVYLTIHKPWNDSNLFHDLYFATDLSSPTPWSYAMRFVYSNAVVTDLSSLDGFFILGPATNGSLTVSTNATAQQLAQMLVPPWVRVTNATYYGANEARGVFAGGNGCGLPLDSGVILSSGDIGNAIGPNTQSDATTRFHIDDIFNGDFDLEQLVGGGGTEDAAVLEFDIVSTNAFTLGFQYVFASEEYPEFIGQFNDPMAIFVSTNLVSTNRINNITNDIALVPGTTNVPVSINTINGGCTNLFNGGPAVPTNRQFYVDNHYPAYSSMVPYKVAAQVFNIQYDGMTVLLTARTNISANVAYHVKIAIADYGDDLYDSAVFIRAWAPCP